MAGAGEERAVRGTGLYLQASRINHGEPGSAHSAHFANAFSGCFPNIARFDYFDAPGAESSSLQFRVGFR